MSAFLSRGAPRGAKAAFLLLLATAFACGPSGNGGSSGAATPAPDLAQPAGFADGVALPAAPDLNPSDDVVEVSLDARVESLELKPGVKTPAWTYNGSVPGPLIRARKGQTLLVHFTNHLPEPTTIHWHGMRVPADMDGTEAMQKPVQPGASFDYAFKLLDAGSYWYHPHINSSAQVGYGLYGAIVVDDPDEPPLGDDVVLVLSDMSLQADGTLAPGNQSGWFGDYFGREGSTPLVNGRVMPTLKLRPGVPQRWRVINAARAHYFRFIVPGQPLVQVGTDGGLMEHASALSEVTLAPGQRIELYVNPVAGAPTVVVPSLDANRFHLPEPAAPDQLMFVSLEGSPGHGAAPLPETLRSIAAPNLAGAPTKSIELMEKPGPNGAVLGINGYTAAEAPEQMAMSGTTEVWTLTNSTSQDHPFHLHGFLFQVLDVDGVAPKSRAWFDTVNLQPKQTLRIAVPFDFRPGMWMFHCHILDHADLGMMAMLHVM